MQSKSIVYLLLINFVLLTFISVHTVAYEELWWNDDWAFRQEIIIPFDTSIDRAKYQPIDVRIEFTNPCWIKNEKEHSIRTIFQDGENLIELDSQIYDLNYTDDNHIKACSIVFLIPEEASGKESYYVYYDNSVKPAKTYVDHVNVEESYYLYEPISGYPFESHFFKIIEDESVVYAVSQEGRFMGYRSSQYVTKLKENTKEVLPKNGELVASFDFRYYYDQGMEYISSTGQQLVSKEILTDGNLMVEFGIVSRSKKDDIQTTAFYKYYYCPTKDKRITTHVKHEIFQGLKVSHDLNTDGVFASLQCGGIKSRSIKDLNFGEILPYLHVFNEDGIIDEYPLDPDPEYLVDDHDIRILSNKDDVDLGEKAWASFDKGKTGLSHSLILGANNVVKSGIEERDGVQINAYEMDYPHLPGLETNIASFEFGRNSYEIGGIQDLDIPEDFVIEFDAEIFSSQTGGFEIINEEADIFQLLVKNKPSYERNISEEDKVTGENKFTVFVHNAYSIPMGAGLSALTGKNFRFITTELYKDDDLLSSGTSERLSLNQIPIFNNKAIFQRITSIFSAFDWKNLSFFKKIVFDDLESGKYLVKIYLENPIFGNERKFIGFKIIDVEKDTKTHVFCRSESSVKISVFNQKEEGVKNADIYLQKDGVIVTKSTTDDKGQAIVKAPLIMFDKYDLKIFYNGFSIYNESIGLGLIGKIIPIKKFLEIEQYDLKIEVVDTWNLPPFVEINPFITSLENDNHEIIYAEDLSEGTYLFTNLIPSSYQLSLKYKSFSLDENIQINEDKNLHLTFDAEFNIKIKTFDSRGTAINDANLIISRDDVDIDVKSDIGDLYLPPGLYHINIFSQNELIGSRKINVVGERNFDLITTQEPLFPLIITILVIVFVFVALIVSYLKKEAIYFLKTLTLSFAITAIVYPWWVLHGSNSQVETTTKMFLYPLNLITTTIHNNTITGELAFLPGIFIDIVTLIPIFTASACFLLILSIFFKNINKKLYLMSILLALIALIGSMLIFSIGMSSLTEAGIGSFIGGGNLEISIPGEVIFTTIYCSWGPAIGLFLYMISIIILFLTIVITIKRKVKKIVS